jgi:DNA replication protein DnaC
MTKTETKSTVLVKHHLKTLKLPTMHAECEKTAARAAQENLDHLAYLLALCELELVDRERRAAERRLKAARFPAAKTLEEFDFDAQPSVNKPLVLELAKGDWLDQGKRTLSLSFDYRVGDGLEKSWQRRIFVDGCCRSFHGGSGDGSYGAVGGVFFGGG